MPIEKVAAAVEPSVEVAVTSMLVLGPIASRSIAAAVVTTPLTGSIANRPPGLLLSGKSTGLNVSYASDAYAVFSTTVPARTFSSTALGVLTLSTATDTSTLSYTSLFRSKVAAAVEPSVEVAVTSMLVLGPIASRLIAAAVVTTPLTGSIANRPPGLL